MADPFGVPDDVNRMPFGAGSPAEEGARTGGVGQFLAKLGSSALQGLVGTLAGPGQLIQPNPYPAGSEGEAWYEDQRDKGMKDWAAGTALNLAGIGSPFAQPGAAGVFGGRLAKTADQAALRMAEEMHAAGADRRAIWDKTGWFKGEDGKWRFEIPDNEAQMHPTYYTMMPSGKMGPVAGEIWHPELYQAYPDLRSIGAMVERTDTAGGSHMPAAASRTGEERININAPNAGTARSVGLHELQHAIQDREGFASGGSPAMFTQADDAALSRDALAWRREMERFPGTPREQNIAAEKAYREAGMDDFDIPSKEARFLAMDTKRNPTDTLSRVVELYGLDKNISPYTPRDLYRSIPGEVEARNVQTRRDMTPEERRAKPPWETEHFLDRVASSPVLNGMFGSRVGLLEGGVGSRSVAMAEPFEGRAFKAMDTDVPNMSDVGLTHVALNRRVAEQFAGNRRPVREVDVSAKKPFDFRDPADLQWLVDEMRKPENVEKFNTETRKIMGEGYDFHHDARNIQAGLEEGLYQAYEVPTVGQLIRGRGYDGIYMVEDQGSPVNLALFHPDQVKVRR